MNTIAIIPARYASTRFPGKPLAKLGGMPVIEHVYRQVNKVVDRVYVATDDDRIMQAVIGFGGHAIMTRNDHKSGTDRVREAMETICSSEKANFDIVINVQGDEPFIHPSQVATLCRQFDLEETQIATLGKPFTTMESVLNPNSPKIIVDCNGYALYFSRSVIPYVRGEQPDKWMEYYPYLKHLGIYAYRKEVLREITQLPQSPLEKAESLEQLRWLENGYRIRVGLTDIETVGIDTPEDLLRAEQFLNRG